jgi:hypothetical protein
MTIISFPAPPAARRRQAEADTALYLVAALRRIGEPATLPELSDLLSEVCGPRTDWMDAFLGSTLQTFCETGLPDAPEIPVFRSVPYNGGSAWAFTQRFRSVLRRFDLPLALRPLPPAASEDLRHEA